MPAEVSLRDFQALEKRVTALEKQLDRDIGEINKINQETRRNHDQLETKINALRKESSTGGGKMDDRVDKLVGDLNKRLLSAKDYDNQLDNKIAALRKQIDNLV